MERPRLSIIIPAYRAVGVIDPLADALSALAQLQSGEYEVLVADDASPDGTAGYIAERWPMLRVVEGDANLGFGGNVMRGAAFAAGEHLAVVNTDIELASDPFPALLDALSDTHVFAAMPLVHNTALGKVENMARLWCRRGLCWHSDAPEASYWTARTRAHVAGVPPPPDDDAHDPARPVQSVLCGACFVCRTAEFRELGGLDPRYRPYYWEDVDLGYRAVERGQVCVTVPAVFVIHRHSETIGSGPAKLRHLLLNQIRFVAAHSRTLAGSGLRHPRWWWLARALREVARTNGELAAAYVRASLGLRV